MRILNEFKIPNFKFPKLKMESISELEEVNIEEPKDRKHIKYETKNFKTVKEMFDKATTEFKNEVFILEKFDHKDPFTEITYSKFREDVIGLGTGLNKILNLRNKRIVVIGENT